VPAFELPAITDEGAHGHYQVFLRGPTGLGPSHDPATGGSRIFESSALDSECNIFWEMLGRLAVGLASRTLTASTDRGRDSLAGAELTPQ
jgi:hypothetical protein